MLLSFFQSNFMTFLLLFALAVIMAVNRKNQVPAARIFRVGIVLMLILIGGDYIERHGFWMVANQIDIPAAVRWRTVGTVICYILRPVIIMLEVLMISPSKRISVFCTAPAIVNAALIVPALFGSSPVFYISEAGQWCEGPLYVAVYAVIFIYLALLFLFSLSYFTKKNIKRGIIILAIIAESVTVSVCEYYNLVSGYTSAVTALCMLEYYVYLSLVYQQQMQEAIVQKERDINRSNLLLLRNQIQPHFIYNSLSIIRSLAKRDSAGAVRCIDSFSEYLKAHIGAIQTDDLISFEQELQNVKTYLSLVQADYTRKVSVIYELNETDFKIPPLSLEPIIENAVSHGISKETGIISIRTERLDDNVQIIVADNGTAEKDPEPIMHNGIGLENTRKRLELHCGGTLEMENSQNGMTVTITVPIQKESI